jgi:hypothetical protein
MFARAAASLCVRLAEHVVMSCGQWSRSWIFTEQSDEAHYSMQDNMRKPPFNAFHRSARVCRCAICKPVALLRARRFLSCHNDQRWATVANMNRKHTPVNTDTVYVTVLSLNLRHTGAA